MICFNGCRSSPNQLLPVDQYCICCLEAKMKLFLNILSQIFQSGSDLCFCGEGHVLRLKYYIINYSNPPPPPPPPPPPHVFTPSVQKIMRFRFILGGRGVYKNRSFFSNFAMHLSGQLVSFFEI